MEKKGTNQNKLNKKISWSNFRSCSFIRVKKVMSVESEETCKSKKHFLCEIQSVIDWRLDVWLNDFFPRIKLKLGNYFPRFVKNKNYFNLQPTNTHFNSSLQNKYFSNCNKSNKTLDHKIDHFVLCPLSFEEVFCINVVKYKNERKFNFFPSILSLSYTVKLFHVLSENKINCNRKNRWAYLHNYVNPKMRSTIWVD
jgi:hypothetical protein